MKINTPADGTYMRPDAAEAGTPLLDRTSRIVSWMSHEGLLKSSVLRNQAARETQIFRLAPLKCSSLRVTHISIAPRGLGPGFWQIRLACGEGHALPQGQRYLEPARGWYWYLKVASWNFWMLGSSCVTADNSHSLSCEAWGRNGRFLSGLLVLFSMTSHNRDWLPVYT